MKIAIFEFLCGGGLTHSNYGMLDSQTLASLRELSNEGRQMLETLSFDLVECGHHVRTCLDLSVVESQIVSRLAQRDVEVVPLRSNERWLTQWCEIAKKHEIAIVIAPELDSHLIVCVDALRDQGTKVYLSDRDFLDAACDKRLTAKHFQAAKVLTPLTWTLSEYLSKSEQNSESEIDSAFTMKRQDGAGCADMMYFSSSRALMNWVRSSGTRHVEAWIVQPWLEGLHSSLAVIVDEQGQLHLVGAMEQQIDIEFLPHQTDVGRVVYRGGRGPIVSVSDKSLLVFANRVIAAMPCGALGWIGIDFLLPHEQSPESEWIAIEINPRLTTSYLGYRLWYGEKLADAILSQTDLQPRLPKPKVEFST